ncbi:MAG: 23S rRNA (pseudouridine(1915)-N(3))-methyltransferase RlmH [Thermodesulfobacteriota bacterium]
MRLKFLFVGRTRESYLAEGVRDFLARINPYVPAEEVVVRGARVREDRADEVRAEDTRRLLTAVRPEDVFVLLDPDGRELTSPGLAAWLKEQMDRGAKTVCFGLGGPLGLDPAAARRADLRLCLSRLTLTHEMSRLVLLEQVYRAMRLIAGHPYHK